MLRVAPPDDAGFLFYERGMMAQEPGLHRLLREKTSLPVAEILFYDDTRTVLDRDCLLMTRLHGAALSETTLAPRATDRVLEELGAYLRELHDQCQAEQYGYLGEHNCMAPSDTWVEAFRTMWGLLIDDIAACGVYDPEEARHAKGLLEKHIEHFDRDVPSCLLHMDIWAQNILVDPHGRVTGIVDWDRALWGDVEIEFAVLDYCGVSLGAFWRGYGRERDRSQAARIRGAFYTLYEVQKYIVIRMLRSKDPVDARRYKAHAARILEQL